MKKIVIAGILASAFGIASAAEVSVGGAYDYKSEQWGTRVTASAGKLGPIVPQVSVTQISNRYTRYAVGTNVDLAQVGNLKVGAGAAGVYQNSFVGDNGYGVTAGLNATYAVTKDFSVVGSIEKFYGQERIKAYDGTVASIGVAYKF